MLITRVDGEAVVTPGRHALRRIDAAEDIFEVEVQAPPGMRMAPAAALPAAAKGVQAVPTAPSTVADAVQLMGMSSHGLHWYGNCVTKSSIRHLVEHWGINVFRAAMY
eukprot:gene12579-50541_t